MGAEGRTMGAARQPWHSSGFPLPTSLGRSREKAEVRREVEGRLATLDAEALLQAYDSHQELLEDPPPSPEARWLLEESRRDDEAAMGAW